MFFKPFLGLGFLNNCQHFDGALGHVIEDAEVIADTEPILRVGYPAQLLDTVVTRGLVYDFSELADATSMKLERPYSANSEKP
jgi:hypothetical protein